MDEGGNIEVVVLDVRMPGLDGIETFKSIRERHPLVEVIMLTGHATVTDAIEGMKRGAFDYLMKPCPHGGTGGKAHGGGRAPAKADEKDYRRP